MTRASQSTSSVNTINAAMNGGSSIPVPVPAANASIIVESAPASVLKFTFDPAQATTERSGNDLVFTLNQGGKVTLHNFFAVGDEALPTLELPSGAQVASADFFADSSMDMSTAAGPAAASAAPSSGSGEYADDAGRLIDGVDRLGSLGTMQWNRSTETPEYRQAPLPAPTAAAETGTPEGDGPAPVESGGFYQARAVLYTQDAANTTQEHLVKTSLLDVAADKQSARNASSFPSADNVRCEFVDENGIPMDVTGQVHAEYKADSGEIWFILDSDAALSSDRIFCRVYNAETGQSYIIQVVLSDTSSFDSRAQDLKDADLLDNGGIIHGEWHAGADSQTAGYKSTSSNLDDVMTFTGDLKSAAINTGYDNSRSRAWGDDSVTVRGNVTNSAMDFGTGTGRLDIDNTLYGTQGASTVTMAHGAVNINADAKGGRLGVSAGTETGSGTGTVTIDAGDAAVSIGAGAESGNASGVQAGAGAARSMGAVTIKGGTVDISAAAYDGQAKGLVATGSYSANSVEAQGDVTVTAAGASAFGMRTDGTNYTGSAKNCITSANGDAHISATATAKEAAAMSAYLRGDNFVSAEHGTVTLETSAVADSASMNAYYSGTNTIDKAESVSLKTVVAPPNQQAGSSYSYPQFHARGMNAEAGGKNTITNVTGTVSLDVGITPPDLPSASNTYPVYHAAGMNAGTMGGYGTISGTNTISYAGGVTMTAHGGTAYSSTSSDPTNAGMLAFTGGTNRIEHIGADGVRIDVSSQGEYDVNNGMRTTSGTNIINDVAGAVNIAVNGRGIIMDASSAKGSNTISNIKGVDADGVSVRLSVNNSEGVSGRGMSATGSETTQNTIENIGGKVLLETQSDGIFASTGRNVIRNIGSDVTIRVSGESGMPTGMEATGQVGTNSIEKVNGQVTLIVEAGAKQYNSTSYAMTSNAAKGGNFIDTAEGVRIEARNGSAGGVNGPVNYPANAAMHVTGGANTITNITGEAGVSLLADSSRATFQGNPTGLNYGMFSGASGTTANVAVNTISNVAHGVHVTAQNGSVTAGMAVTGKGVNVIDTAESLTVTAKDGRDKNTGILNCGGRNEILTVDTVTITAKGSGASINTGMGAFAPDAQNSIHDVDSVLVQASGGAQATGVSASGNTGQLVGNGIETRTAAVFASGAAANTGIYSGNGGSNSIITQEDVTVAAGYARDAKGGPVKAQGTTASGMLAEHTLTTVSVPRTFDNCSNLNSLNAGGDVGIMAAASSSAAGMRAVSSATGAKASVSMSNDRSTNTVTAGGEAVIRAVSDGKAYGLTAENTANLNGGVNAVINHSTLLNQVAAAGVSVAATAGTGAAYGMHAANTAGGGAKAAIADSSASNQITSSRVEITAHSDSGDAHGMYAGNSANQNASITNSTASNIITVGSGPLSVIITAHTGSDLAREYAMYAGMGGSNQIIGKSFQGGAGDYVELHGDIYSLAASTAATGNSIKTGQGDDRVILDGMVKAGSLHIEAGDAQGGSHVADYDILVLRAENWDDFSFKYGDWLRNYEGGSDVLWSMHIESLQWALDDGGAAGSMPQWLTDLVGQYNANHPDAPPLDLSQAAFTDLDGIYGAGHDVSNYVDHHGSIDGSADSLHATADFGGGDDHLHVTRDVAHTTVNMGDGHDTLIIDGCVNDAVINMGAGDDVLHAGGIGSGAAISGGEGMDTLHLHADSLADLSLGDLFDLSGVSSFEKVFVNLAGGGQNTFTPDMETLGQLQGVAHNSDQGVTKAEVFVTGDTAAGHQNTVDLSGGVWSKGADVHAGFDTYTNGEDTIYVQQQMLVTGITG